MTEFSIIIPAYNCERYISRCLNSIISQKSSSSYEVIVVNDGSTDDTEAVIRTFVQRYTNITLINTDNKGVSNARNVGLEAIKGEYVIFVDADDWVSEGYIDYLAKELASSNADGIVLGHYRDFDGESKRYIPHKELTCDSLCFSSDEYLRYFALGYITNAPWDKIFKASVYKNGALKFPYGLTVGEDAVMTVLLGLASQKIAVRCDAFLHYMQDTGGVTKTNYVSERKFCDAVKSITQMSMLLHERKCVPSFLVDKMLLRQIAYYYFMSSSHLRTLHENRFVTKLALSILAKRKAGLKWLSIAFLVLIARPIFLRRIVKWALMPYIRR